ncbi:MAG: peptidoglycan-binding domain-containing protein [Candidatus Nanopelagicales bacterium]
MSLDQKQRGVLYASIMSILGLLVGLLIGVNTESTPEPAKPVEQVQPVEVNVNLANPPTTATLAEMNPTPPGERNDLPNGRTPSESGLNPNPAPQILDGWGAASQTFVSTKNLRRDNPWTPQQAVTYAIGQAKNPDKNYYMLCEHFASWVYGWGGSGYASAKAHALATPSSRRNKIPSDHSKIPAGALIYFTEGTYGHVVVAVGNGKVASNDIVKPGDIDIVPLSRFKQKWGYTPDMWKLPDFPRAFGRNPNRAPVVKPQAKPAPKPATKTKPVVKLSNVRVGKRNAQVKRVQTALRNRGAAYRKLNRSGATGYYGTQTRNMVQRYQRSLGFKGRDADGRIGCTSLKRLNKANGLKWTVKC